MSAGNKLNRIERNWVLYDVGNSAFTMLMTTIIPIYFNHLAGSAGLSDVQYLAYWGYAASIATFFVALLGPVLGTMSDAPGWRKKLFSVMVLVGSLGCVVLGFMRSWMAFLILFILVRIAYSVSLVFYDSMLTDITTPERMDGVSAKGYAWGYIGSCVPFVGSLLLVLLYDKIGLSFNTAIAGAFCLTALWWLLLTLPLWFCYEQKHAEANVHPIESLARLGRVFGELSKNRPVLLFLVAFFFYIDGVYTVIDMATAYGTALGLESSGLLLALLLTQIVAFPSALFFGRLSGKHPVSRLILVCIGAYFCVAVYALFLRQQYQFWILAVVVGMFQGAIQSLSRSFFARIIPPERSGEYFGIYDICGKGASLIGTTLVGVITQLTGQLNLGVGSLTVMFLVGGLVFLRVSRLAEKQSFSV